MENKSKVTVQSGVGLLWIAGWLFTLGFLKLAFWKGLLALLIWPYYIGEFFTSNNIHSQTFLK